MSTLDGRSSKSPTRRRSRLSLDRERKKIGRTSPVLVSGDQSAGRRPRTVAPAGADGIKIYHGGDPILMLLRLTDLQRNGYVDFRSETNIGKRGIDHHSDPMPAIDTEFVVPHDRKELFLPIGVPDVPIHPIVRRENWVNISTSMWEQLLPVLRLVSCILYEPSTSPYFTGLLDMPHTPISDVPPETTARYGPMHRFESVPFHESDHHGRLQHIKTQRTLFAMRDQVEWAFDSDLKGAWGRTWRRTGHLPFKAGLRPGGHASMIHLHGTLFRSVVGIETANQFPKARNFDPEAGQVRACYFTAFVMIHELSHALGFTSSGVKAESFFENQRLAEMGYAAEVAITGSLIAPNGMNNIKGLGASASAPYGLRAINWPGSMDYSKAPRRASAVFSNSQTFHYPVKMADIHKFLTTKFWARDVAASNGLALRVPTSIAVHGHRRSDKRMSNEQGPPVPREPFGRLTTRSELLRLGFASRTAWYMNSDSEEEREILQ